MRRFMSNAIAGFSKGKGEKKAPVEEALEACRNKLAKLAAHEDNAKALLDAMEAAGTLSRRRRRKSADSGRMMPATLLWETEPSSPSM